MASGSHYGGFFGGGYKIGFDWSSSRVGNENASNVTVVPYLYIKSGYSISSSASKSGTVTINGTNHNFNFTLGNVRGETWVRLSNGFTTKVGHNSDGSKSCTLKVTATLNLNLSGSQIGAVSDQATVTLDKFNLNSAPTMPAGITVNPNGGYIPENGTSVTISWSKASDPDGNLSNHILDCCKNGTWMTWATLGKDTTSYTDTIPKGEGDTYQYRVIARDSAGLYSNHSNVSAKLTTNTLRGGSFSNAPSINYNTSSITMNFSGGSNTDGTAARYMCYSDDITIYNQTETTSGSQAITIYKSGSTPSGPYIRFDDLKNRFKNSSYNGRMHIGLRTGNGRGTYKYSSTTLSVDLRTNPSAPGAVTILQDSNSTAYKTHSGTGSKYFVPDGTNYIRFTYTAASDPLGGEIKYKLYQIYNGNVSLLAENVTGVGGYNFTPPKLSGNSTATLAFRVEAITSYGRSSSKDSAQITLHSYNGVSFSLGTITRTATDATVNITVKTTSSVPNINTVGTWSCNNKSGNLTTSQSQQSFKVTGLTEGGTYTATVTYKDNTGWSSNQTASVSIGSLAPIVAITKEGLGVGGVEANANAALNVKGNTVINEGKLTFSKQKGGGQMSSLINCQELQDNTGNGQMLTAHNNTVYVGNPNTQLYLESLNNPTLVRNGANFTLYHTGNKPTANDVGALPIGGGTLTGVLSVSGNSKTITMGTGGSDVYITNSASGKYLQLKDNGTLSYDDKLIYHEGNSGGPTQGNWFSGGFPRVATDGVMEIGRFVDFHNTSTTTSDYSTRLSANGDNRNTVYLPTGNGTLCLENHVHNNYLGNSGSQTLNVAGGKFLITGNGGYGHIDVAGGFHTRGDSSDIWYERHIMPASWANASLYLGYSDKRWKAVYAANGTIQTSDKRHKAVIDNISSQDCFNMVKNTDIFSYVMLEKNKEEMDEFERVEATLMNSGNDENIKMGILAQDILDYDCSKYVLTYSEYTDEETGETKDYYGIDAYAFSSSIMGALKHEISLREKENDELKQEINELKQELAQIKQLLIK